MKKKNNKGFVLAETLIVTTFVAGVLIFLYIQFSNLSKSYDESYIYNTTEGLYALEDLKAYIETDLAFVEWVESNIGLLKYIDITNCSIFTDRLYCENLMRLENIEKVFISTNELPKNEIENYNEEFTNFINKINKEGNEKYRLVASFKGGSFATLRVGENYE